MHTPGHPPGHQTSGVTRASVWTRLFSGLSRLLVTIPVKIIVTLVTLGCLAGGIYGTLHLRMEFKPEWLMDPNSEGEILCNSETDEKIHS